MLGLVHILELAQLLLLLVPHLTAQREHADPRFDLAAISAIKAKFSTVKDKIALFLVRDAKTKITYILEHSIRLAYSLLYK